MPRRLVAAAVLGMLALPLTLPPQALASADHRAACSSGNVSLTFDDGPSPSQTPRLVRILKDAGVPATFFMVGARVDAAPETARLVAASGFLIANHSYLHEDMTRQSTPAIRATLARTRRSLVRAGTTPTDLMRPPYGAVDGRVLGAIADSGLVPVLWDVDPRDWAGGSAETIAARILAQLRPHRSNVVLQHDGISNSAASIAAVPRVIREARRRGYCFVALDDDGEPGFPVPRASLSVKGSREGRAARAWVTLDRPTARQTTVRLVTRSGTAKAGADFARRALNVRFPAGSVRQKVKIPLLRDRLDEAKEHFSVKLDRPRFLTLDTAKGKVAVADVDPPPTVSVLDRSVEEPALESLVAEVRVRLGRVSGRDVEVRVVDVPGTATPGDYDPVDARVLIPAGSRWVVVPVRINADAEVEADESFGLRIVSASRARPLRTNAVVTITAPPAPPPPPPPPPDPPTDPPAPDPEPRAGTASGTDIVGDAQSGKRIRRQQAV